MNPREAQEQTERKWACLSNKDLADTDAPGCGWCAFASSIQGQGCIREFCPVVRVFSVSCFDIPEYREWEQGPTGDAAAQMVYDLAVANRDALIQAGEEILREQDIRKSRNMD